MSVPQFGPQWKYVKYVRVPTQACVLNYHLPTVTTRLIIKGKGKVHPRTGHEGSEEE